MGVRKVRDKKYKRKNRAQWMSLMHALHQSIRFLSVTFLQWFSVSWSGVNASLLPLGIPVS